MDISTLLGRLDEEAYQDILGREVIGTLNALGSNYLYSDNLLKILRNTYSDDELLIRKPSRIQLINIMNSEEVSIMAELFNLPNDANVYQNLNNLVFKGINQEKLFNLFNIEIPFEVPELWVSSNIITSRYPLYPYQGAVLKKIQSFLNSSKNRALLHMPTGSGKTRTAISFICRYLVENNGSNVVWFANTKELLDQAYDEFTKAWEFLGDRELEAIKFWDKSDIDLTTIKSSFIVAGLDKSYQALMKDIGAMSIFANNCSLVIMDEAHMAIAPSYRLLIQNMIANNASLIGLSATPGRTWNDPAEDKKLADFFFRQKAKLEIPGYENPVDYLTENGYLAKVQNTRLFSNVGISLTPDDIKYLAEKYVLPQHILKVISESKMRNMAIISKVKELVKVHHRIILFAITKDHAIVLNSLLTALGIGSKVITSETLTVDRVNIIKKFKQPISEFPEPMVLCNFGILTTGFDAPETSCAVIARPTDSLVLYSQMVGRAIRGIRSGGNEHAEIVTVIDENLPGFKEVAEAFINWEDVWEN